MSNLPHEAPQGVSANTISLLLGHPDPTTLFTPELQQTLQRVLASPGMVQALQYGNEQGNLALIAFLVEKISREQQIALSNDHLMLVAGSTHAVDLIGRLYTQPGDVVIVEAPTYADAIHIFRDHGVELCSVPLDADGASAAAFAALLERLSAAGKRTAVFYTIPNFHNPSGITTAEPRRREILRLARQHNMLVVEDDVYRDLAFEGTIPASYYALAEGRGVMQIGSFSKTLAPGLRLGWLLATTDDIQRFVGCGTTQMGGGASPLSAQIVAEYCREGLWQAHVERLRALYLLRRDTMLAALEQHMPAGVRWTTPQGGFFLWLTLPEGVAGQAVKRVALERGVLVAAGEGYFIDPADGARHLRLTYSFAPPEQIDAAVRILAQVITELS
jgi:2-aminoadipate transaminase